MFVRMLHVIRDAHYVFKIYNEDNVLIAEKKGITSIAPKSVRPVIDNNILRGPNFKP